MGKRKQNYLSKDEAKTLNERYKKFNELVEKEYLGGNQLFSEEIKERVVNKPDYDRDYKNAVIIRELVEQHIKEKQDK